MKKENLICLSFAFLLLSVLVVDVKATNWSFPPYQYGTTDTSGEGEASVNPSTGLLEVRSITLRNQHGTATSCAWSKITAGGDIYIWWAYVLKGYIEAYGSAFADITLSVKVEDQAGNVVTSKELFHKEAWVWQHFDIDESVDNIHPFNNTWMVTLPASGDYNVTTILYGRSDCESAAIVANCDFLSGDYRAEFSMYVTDRLPMCPTLSIWNGTDYVEEGVLNIHAYSDITVQHEITQPLVPENGQYKLQLRELQNNTSHIDQVKLYAVDYEGEWHLCPLTYAYHNLLGNVKRTLRFDDDNRVDLKPTETIGLKFAQPLPYGETARFIFEINGYNMK